MKLTPGAVYLKTSKLRDFWKYRNGEWYPNVTNFNSLLNNYEIGGAVEWSLVRTNIFKEWEEFDTRNGAKFIWKLISDSKQMGEMEFYDESRKYSMLVTTSQVLVESPHKAPWKSEGKWTTTVTLPSTTGNFKNA